MGVEIREEKLNNISMVHSIFTCDFETHPEEKSLGNEILIHPVLSGISLCCKSQDCVCIFAREFDRISNFSGFKFSKCSLSRISQELVRMGSIFTSLRCLKDRDSLI